jgi:hypothetical protein
MLLDLTGLRQSLGDRFTLVQRLQANEFQTNSNEIWNV